MGEDIRNMQVVFIEDVRPGMILGGAVYNMHGLKLLDAGAKIMSNDQITRLEEQGVRRILVDLGGTVKIVPETPLPVIPKSVPAPKRQTPTEFVGELKAELEVAREVYDSAGHVIENVMHDIRMGKHIDNEAIVTAAHDLMTSVLRNPHAMVSLANLKRLDEYTFRHSVNVTAISIALAEHLNLEPHLIELIGVGGLMHDIGKARIPMNIINKPGALSPEEFATVKRHPGFGCEICDDEGFTDSIVLDIVRHHHEAYDGSGYPDGLTHKQISKYAAIVSIADYYDALTTVRSYKKKITPPEAISIMNATANTKFDRRLVFHFIKIIGIYPIGSVVKLASGRIAIIAGFQADDLLNPIIKVLVNANHTMNTDTDVLPLKEMDDAIVELNTDFRFMSNIEDVL